MDNEESSIKHLFRSHDQIQVFLGKPEPGILEEPRKIMTVWRKQKLIWAGPVDEDILGDPRIVVRTLQVYIPLGSHRAFVYDPYKEIRDHGVG